MVITGLRRIPRAAGLATLGLVWAGGTASAQEIRTNYHLPLHLMDLSFAADTSSGVHLLMVPSMRSTQGREPGGLVWLRFHPDTVLEWINHAALALRVPAPNAQADGVQWSRVLPSRTGGGAVAVGRERRKGKLQKGHWLAIADSIAGWRAEMGGADADSLLKLLLLVGSRSRVDTNGTAALEADRVDVPVSVIHQPALKGTGTPSRVLGRVVMAYVVTADGSVEEGSMVAYLVSNPSLVPLAMEVVRDSRFRPAQRGGRPVRQLVYQTMTWKPRP
jgi:hypothetical protein